MELARVADRRSAMAKILIPNIIGVVDRYSIIVDVDIRMKYIVRSIYNEKS